MERLTETRLSQPKYNRRKLNGQLTSLTRHHLLSKHHFGLHSLWGEKSPLGIKQLARLRSLDSIHLWWAQIGKNFVLFLLQHGQSKLSTIADCSSHFLH